MSTVLVSAHELLARHMLARNRASSAFFPREAERLAAICRLMARRFERGGRLLAIGDAHAASDAQHIVVEFLHPVLVGKRALPALDVSAGYRDTLPALVRHDDIVVALARPEGDEDVDAALRDAARHGALVLALPGTCGDYTIEALSADPFVHQELVEVLYHTLWETVHVFFEHQTLNESAGAAAFLYPFLDSTRDSLDTLVPEVAASIRAKAAHVERLRDQVTTSQSSQIVSSVLAMRAAIERGATVLCAGNGGSATDATDFAFDLCASPKGHQRVPAISLASDPATLTAIANDIGSEALFTRQLIACGRRGDVLVVFSTSGGSANIIAALAEARARGILTIALLGYDGGEVRRQQLADHVIVVNSDQIPRIQEVQASIYHVMLDLLDAVRLTRG